MPEKLEVVWCDEVKAVWDKWFNYCVTLDEFRGALMDKGVPFARANRAIAWIADATEAKGVFPPDVQDFISRDVFKTYASNGIKYFISIQPRSQLTKLAVKRYESKVGPNGIQLITVNSIDEAFAFLEEQAKLGA